MMFENDLALTEETAGSDGSVWGMESSNGIERAESKYGENKVNGNWKRVETLSLI